MKVSELMSQSDEHLNTYYDNEFNWTYHLQLVALMIWFNMKILSKT